jgi:hypothetical protein
MDRPPKSQAELEAQATEQTAAAIARAKRYPPDRPSERSNMLEYDSQPTTQPGDTHD